MFYSMLINTVIFRLFLSSSAYCNNTAMLLFSQFLKNTYNNSNNSNNDDVGLTVLWVSRRAPLVLAPGVWLVALPRS